MCVHLAWDLQRRFQVIAMNSRVSVIGEEIGLIDFLMHAVIVVFHIGAAAKAALFYRMAHSSSEYTSCRKSLRNQFPISSRLIATDFPCLGGSIIFRITGRLIQVAMKLQSSLDKSIVGPGIIIEKIHRNLIVYICSTYPCMQKGLQG